MKLVTNVSRNEVGFSNLFRWAEKKYNKGWNHWCDVFHGSELLTYEGYDDIEIGELRSQLKEFDEDKLEYEDRAEGLQVLIEFLEEEQINEVRIYG